MWLNKARNGVWNISGQTLKLKLGVDVNFHFFISAV